MSLNKSSIIATLLHIGPEIRIERLCRETAVPVLSG